VKITRKEWLNSRNKEVDSQIAYERKHPFYVINEFAQVFAGLRQGYPFFSDNVTEAKPIYNNEQFRSIRRGHLYKIERIELQDLL
jgi:hypothetical protein